MRRALARFGWAALMAGWAVDLFFWQKAPGISFPLWVALSIAIGLGLARSLKARVSPYSLVLIAVALFFAAIPFLRQESFSVLLSFLLCLLTLVLLSATFLTGHWVYYKISDLVMAVLKFLLALLIRPADLFMRKPVTTAAPLPAQPMPPASLPVDESEHPAPAPVAHSTGWKGAGRQIAPVVRGLLLALPVVFVLGALLASADPVFNQWTRDLLKIFDLSRLSEYMLRLLYILMVAYILTGTYLHAIQPTVLEARPQPSARWFAPFLGWTEGVVVLAAVNLLFAVFVGIQFWYLFGGQANISTTGFTYSEYARRGFNELVMVALLSLGLYLSLGAITRQNSAGERKIWTGLNALLIVQVLAILASSLNRLLLYENAYGFTQLRTYTHIFIVWLALLLIATLLMEFTRRRHHFALAAMLVSVGFGMTFGLINIDGFIVDQNVQRTPQDSVAFDGQYLTSLSDDAVPALLREFNRTDLAPSIHDALGAELACRAALVAGRTPLNSWLSYNLSRATAESLLYTNQNLWQAYPVIQQQGLLVVDLPGNQHPCQNRSFID